MSLRVGRGSFTFAGRRMTPGDVITDDMLRRAWPKEQKRRSMVMTLTRLYGLKEIQEVEVCECGRTDVEPTRRHKTPDGEWHRMEAA